MLFIIYTYSAFLIILELIQMYNEDYRNKFEK